MVHALESKFQNKRMLIFYDYKLLIITVWRFVILNKNLFTILKRLWRIVIV